MHYSSVFKSMAVFAYAKVQCSKLLHFSSYPAISFHKIKMKQIEFGVGEDHKLRKSYPLQDHYLYIIFYGLRVCFMCLFFRFVTFSFWGIWGLPGLHYKITETRLGINVMGIQSFVIFWSVPLHVEKIGDVNFFVNEKV